VRLDDVCITSSGDRVGGLVGCNDAGIIARVRVAGSVAGRDRVGGVAGKNSAGFVAACSHAGSVLGQDDVGALTGQNQEGSIVASCTTGEVQGANRVGGLIGHHEKGTVTATYSTCRVLGIEAVGGLVGENDNGSLTTSYSLGAVLGEKHVGGAVGQMQGGDLFACFWDSANVQGPDPDAGTGGRRLSVHDPNSYVLAGWDFVDESERGTCDYWIAGDGPYPRLAVFEGRYPAAPQGAGTPADPYRITHAAELGSLWFRPLAHYRLEGDITLAEITWNKAVIPWFGGVLNGEQFNIDHLCMRGGGFLGLFGVLGNEAEVAKLKVSHADIEGRGDRVGGLTGFNRSGRLISNHFSGIVSGGRCVGGLVGEQKLGAIVASSTTGHVRGGDDVGGVAGYNAAGQIHTSCNRAEVQGEDRVGGLVGNHQGAIIESCYSTGPVKGISAVGGLVGWQYMGITVACYSTGTIEADYIAGGLLAYDHGVHSSGNPIRIIRCFWDRQQSAMNQSHGGAGLSTIQMHDIDTYLNALWDFEGESVNGTDDLWWIDDGRDTPRLWWESRRGQP
jgi:hypothetical protein